MSEFTLEGDLGNGFVKEDNLNKMFETYHLGFKHGGGRDALYTINGKEDFPVRAVIQAGYNTGTGQIGKKEKFFLFVHRDGDRVVKLNDQSFYWKRVEEDERGKEPKFDKNDCVTRDKVAAMIRRDLWPAGTGQAVLCRGSD